MNVSSVEKGSHLAMIIDVNSNSRLLNDHHEELYCQWLDSALSFANTHLLMSPLNKLTIIGTNSLENAILYPNDGNDNATIESHDGQYELFTRVSRVVNDKLKAMITKAKNIIESQESSHDLRSSLMSGAISVALCCINKCKDNYKCSRIAIISCNSDSNTSHASQYMNFMNAFFTAQRMGIVIDVCIADNGYANAEGSSLTSSILHQGSDLTDGIYIKVPKVSAFLEYLIWCLLPDNEIRSKLVLPQRKKMSHSAACFCHRNLIEIGYVCSVCLSIFCTFSPICSTCHTHFKLRALPTVLTAKKKQKK